MKKSRKLIIAVLCIVSLCGLFYGIRAWNRTNVIKEKFKKATFAAYHKQEVKKPTKKPTK